MRQIIAEQFEPEWIGIRVSTTYRNRDRRSGRALWPAAPCGSGAGRRAIQPADPGRSPRRSLYGRAPTETLENVPDTCDEEIDGSWRDWGRFRAVAHRVIYAALTSDIISSPCHLVIEGDLDNASSTASPLH